MKNHNNILKMVISALFLALAYIMPYITGQVPEIGSMLCPMHFPVILCGFLCGWQWGLVVGFVSPLFRSAIAGMPPMFPTALAMSFELAAYGALSGLLYKILPSKKIFIYASLIVSMLSGRIIWGTVMAVLLTSKGGFGFSAFIAGAFTNALPGIFAQIILLPPFIMIIEKMNFFGKLHKDKSIQK